jgi:hypothetical protein
MAKLQLNDILSAIDQGGMDIWDLLDNEQRKEVKFFLLNRYVSAIKGASREVKEHYILAVNELFNKHYGITYKHPKLQWQLLCSCAYETKQTYSHEWIGFKQKKNESKRLKFLQELYPSANKKDLEVLAAINSDRDLKAMAEKMCWDEKEIKKYF